MQSVHLVRKRGSVVSNMEAIPQLVSYKQIREALRDKSASAYLAVVRQPAESDGASTDRAMR